MKILIIEDEEKIAKSIAKGLKQESYSVDISFTGEKGYQLASSGDYDLIILDLMLPDIDGFEICQKLKKFNVSTPILMLTARGEIEDKVNGLNFGADDYLVKPFNFDELLARIRAIARRPRHEISSILIYEDLILDTQKSEISRNGKIIQLSKKEYNLLEYLMKNSEKTLSKENIIDHVWEFDSEILYNTVEVYMGYLRTKIDKNFPNLPTLIQTVRGFGYKLSTKK